jgi:hypothetical protein
MSLWLYFYGNYPQVFEWTLWKLNAADGSIETIIERDTATATSPGRQDINVEIEVVPLELRAVSVTAVTFQGYWAGWINGTYEGGRYWSSPGEPAPGFHPETWNNGYDLQFEMTFATVPEPATALLLAAGIVAIGAVGFACRRVRT